MSDHLSRIVLALSAVYLFTSDASAQPLRFHHFGTAQGLSQNSALCLLQDRRGFLWIGTQYGLNRYDGHSFSPYSHDPSDSTSLADNYVVGLAEDTRQRLWVSLLPGQVDVYDPVTDSFEHLRIDSQFRSAQVPPAAILLREQSGGIWIGFQNGKLLRLPADSLHLSAQQLLDHAANRAMLVPGGVQSLFEDSRGNLWAGGAKSITRMRHAQHGPGESATILGTWRTEGTVFSFAEVTGMPGIVWVGTEEGVRLLDYERNTFLSGGEQFLSNSSLQKEPVWTMTEVEPGVLWVGTTTKGLFEVDIHRRRITQHAHNPAHPDGPGSNWITSILVDRSGVTWLGFLTSGIDKTLRNSYPFRFVGYDPHDRSSLRDADVTAILEDRSRTLWVGTRKGGLHRSREPADSLLFHFHQYPVGRNDTGKLPDPYVKALHEDRRGTLWVGLWAHPGGLFRADARRESFTRFSKDSAWPFTLPSNLMRVIRDDGDGYLWLGMTGGLSRIHLDSLDIGRFHTYPVGLSDPHSMSQEDVFSLVISERSHQKEVWIGTFGAGLNKLIPASGTFVQFRSATCNERITSTFEDRAGNIWIGTLGGLALLSSGNRATGAFECFDEQAGLLHKVVQAIVEDNAGDIWLSTQGGLSRFNPSTRTFTNFHSGTHLAITEFNVNAASKGADGRLYFGGVNGFIHFHPDSIRMNTKPPPVVISSFKVFEKEVPLDTSISFKRQVRLRYDENFLSFEFTALDYREPEKNRYAYMMEGIHADWVYTGNRRYASFSNLEPGDYVFRVKASNNDGTWNDHGTALQIVLAPPFWMTAWFRFLAGILIAVTLIGAVRFFSIRRLKKKVEELERQKAIQRERDRISRELHDSVGSSLVGLVSGLELAGKYAKSGTTQTGKLLSSLHDDARAGIGQLRETIWALSTNEMPWQKFVPALEQHVGNIVKYRKRPKLHFTADAAAELVLTPIQSLNLLRIAQEAVTNSVKHARAKNVWVDLTVIDASVQLIVRDDGNGKCSEGAGRGRGLMNMQTRAEEVGGQFALTSEAGKGTSIEVTIPVQRVSS
ncbi:MAG: hypothetical protein KF749_12890 [Bacteroidetes bacterium]|nr:hypothetical protein [Bacteroidota bacterium]MCW5894408.1 hypothetical protein [Bacteroidota bacterium]